jgi:hypothetical protein
MISLLRLNSEKNEKEKEILRSTLYKKIVFIKYREPVFSFETQKVCV